jgi:hypothetical protein
MAADGKCSTASVSDLGARMHDTMPKAIVLFDDLPFDKSQGLPRQLSDVGEAIV